MTAPQCYRIRTFYDRILCYTVFIIGYREQPSNFVCLRTRRLIVYVIYKKRIKLLEVEFVVVRVFLKLITLFRIDERTITISRNENKVYLRRCDIFLFKQLFYYTYLISDGCKNDR